MSKNKSCISGQKKENKISRRLTVNIQEPYITIRPIIKKSDTEAANTLSEAYAGNALLNWITGSTKDEKKKFDMFQDIFKALICTAVGESREFAVQYNGCKGVLLWSEDQSETLSLDNILRKKRFWRTLSGLSTMHSTWIHHYHLVKTRKKIMAGRRYLSINFIGVLPIERRKRIGTALIQYVLKKADEVQLPVFAEVWGQDVLSWFQKHDFVVNANKSLSDKENVVVYYVVREPQLDSKTPRISSSGEAMAALNLEPPREDTFTTQQDA